MYFLERFEVGIPNSQGIKSRQGVIAVDGKEFVTENKRQADGSETSGNVASGRD